MEESSGLPANAGSTGDGDYAVMITSLAWINPTRTIGLAAYAGAFVCCGLTWVRMKERPKTARLAAGLMLIEGVLLVDMAFNWRWKLHQAILEFAMQKHDYDQRHLPQVIVLMLMAGLVLIGFTTALRSFRGRGTTLLAVAAAMVSTLLWCVEVVSLHAVDHVLYSSFAGVDVVSFFWILACAATSIGILQDPQ